MDRSKAAISFEFHKEKSEIFSSNFSKKEYCKNKYMELLRNDWR